VTDGPRLYLAGLMGAGKTTVAERIAAWLGCPVIDVDREVERRAGTTVAELWSSRGEAAFRAAEREAVGRIVESEEPAVVALGGGTLEDPGSRERLAAWGRGVWLDAPAGLLARRAAGAERPLLAGADGRREAEERLAALAAARLPRYRALGHRVGVDGREVEAVAVEVLRALEWPSPARIAGEVVAGRDAAGRAATLLSDALPAVRPGPVVVVSDPIVRGLHGEALETGLAAGGWEPAWCVLPAGEPAKEVDGLVVIWDALLAAGADRDTPLVVLGGGAAGDVGGMAAATWKRGIPLALFPTTLLAQVDAAIGGKNAIDRNGVKNIVGTFHFPALVASDPLCLLTLPEREWRSGWAEVVKAGLIGDPELFALCEAEPGAIAARRLDVVEVAIERAVRVKVEVVADDPREAGRRRVLNLGHTLGHAIESEACGDVSHGEAVSIGLVAAARLAEREGVAAKGLADRVAAALVGLGLPTAVPVGLDPGRLVERVRHDKKRAGGRLHVVLPARPGTIEVLPVDGAAVARWIEEEA